MKNLFAFLAFLAFVNAVTIKIFNQMGGSGLSFSCSNKGIIIGSDDGITNGQSRTVNFKNSCSNDVTCEGQANAKGHIDPVSMCKGCKCGNVGLFLKPNGIFKGDLNGKNLKKVADYQR